MRRAGERLTSLHSAARVVVLRCAQEPDARVMVACPALVFKHPWFGGRDLPQCILDLTAEGVTGSLAVAGSIGAVSSAIVALLACGVRRDRCATRTDRTARRMTSRGLSWSYGMIRGTLATKWTGLRSAFGGDRRRRLGGVRDSPSGDPFESGRYWRGSESWCGWRARVSRIGSTA